MWIIGNKSNESNKQILKSLIWITYRSGFPCFANSDMTSDVGWGCTLRSSQMMLANALKREYPEDVIINLFSDYPSLTNPYSIHNMLTHGKCFGKKIGEQYGPNATCIMLKKCNQFNPRNPVDINIQIIENGTIYKDCFIQENWKTTIVFIPLRLGLNDINSEYIESIKKTFELHQSLGIVGGKTGSSFYFIGYENDKLLCLDPHKVQKVNEIKTECPNIKSLNIETIDPTLALGFYCKTYHSFLELCEFKTNLFKVENTKPNYLEKENKEVNEFVVI